MTNFLGHKVDIKYYLVKVALTVTMVIVSDLHSHDQMTVYVFKLKDMDLVWYRDDRQPACVISTCDSVLILHF